MIGLQGIVLDHEYGEWIILSLLGMGLYGLHESQDIRRLGEVSAAPSAHGMHPGFEVRPVGQHDQWDGAPPGGLQLQQRTRRRG